MLDVFLHWISSDNDIRLAVLDKGILAFILAFFTAIAAYIIDRHKDALNRQTDNLRADREQRIAGEREERDRKNEEELSARQQIASEISAEKEEAKAAAENERLRLNYPRTEFDIRCRFFGPQSGRVITEVQIIAINRGLTLRWIESMKIEILGLRADTKPSFHHLRDGAQRLNFADFKSSHEIKSVFTVEPGVTQIFPLMTLIDQGLSYILIRAKVFTRPFNNLPETSYYTEERFFPVALETKP